MGQQSSCCQELSPEVQPVEITHCKYVVDGKEENGENGENGEKAFVQEASDPISTRTTQMTLAQCRLQKMDHLMVDQEVLRGISLRDSLRSGGSLWRTSPVDMPLQDRQQLWSRSRNVESFDYFLSHTWLTPGKLKVVSLLLRFSWPAWLGSWLLLVSLAFSLTAAGVLPMFGSWPHQGPQFQAECPIGIWGMLASIVSLPLGVCIFMSVPLAWRSDTCFLDVVSIHQTDKDMMERGIYGLGGFLKVSKQLLVLWSPPYLSRLWCVFELAAFRTANPTGKITLAPIYVESGLMSLHLAFCLGTLLFQLANLNLPGNFGLAAYWIGLLPSVVALHFMRKMAMVEQELLAELRNFNVDKAQCRTDFDREFIEAAIIQWYGSKEAFTEYVRGPLTLELLSALANSSTFWGYAFLMTTSPVAAGLEAFLSLWMCGAPWEAVLAQLVGGVIGLDFLHCLLSLQIAIVTLDGLTRVSRGTWLGNQVHLITLIAWVVFIASYMAGAAVSTLASTTSAWAATAFTLTLAFLVPVVKFLSDWLLLPSGPSVQPVSDALCPC